MRVAPDVLQDVKFDNVLPPEVLNAGSQVTASVDMAQFDRAFFRLSIGAAGETFSGSRYFTAALEESDDNTTFTHCADALMRIEGGLPISGYFAKIDSPGEAGTQILVEYLGSKRYVRVNVTGIGTHTNGTPMDIVAIRNGAKNLPCN
ncbi:MAG: hypothetical protein GY835_05695 [bacterium]|nr:hypothetical protein [bacterium]